MHRLGLRAAGLAAGLIAGLALAQPGASRHPELDRLLATPLDGDASAQMHWPSVLSSLGRPDDATAVGDHLLARWLAQLTGGSPGAVLTIEQARRLLGARAVATHQQIAQAWPQAFERQLVLRLTAPAQLPQDLDYLRNRLDAPAPGLWVHRMAGPAGSRVFAWVELRNRGPEPFPTAPATLVTPEGQLPCDQERGADAQLLAAGEAGGLLCQASLPPGQADVLAAQLPGWLAAGHARLQARPLASEQARAALMLALARPQRARAEALVSEFRAQVSQRHAQAHAQSTARTAARERRIDLALRAGVTLGVILLIAFYIAVARARGPRFASWLLFGVGSAVSVPTGLWLLTHLPGSGLGGIGILFIATWLFIGPAAAAVVAYAVATFVRRMLDESEYRAQIIWGIAGTLGLTALYLLFVLVSRLV